MTFLSVRAHVRARVCVCLKPEGPLCKHVINLYTSHWTLSSLILKPRSSVTSDICNMLQGEVEKTNKLHS